ncbi:glycosyl-transferase for dystroglycan-domain-containing protein [Irpex lacteus]|nr:glycosyl-transferase for dystroglycan-domain-containing protein [Irpex lacteus]
MDNADSDTPALPWSFSSAESSLYLNDLNSNIDALLQKQRESQALPTSIQEGIFLSKAFAQSMHPTKIIPFFYKATSPVDENDVTITTLVTSNRYKVLRQLVDRYQGPISVTIHIPLPSYEFGSPSVTATRHFISALKDLESLYASSPHFARYVDVHLALSPVSSGSNSGSNSLVSHDQSQTGGARQFNVWRNIARLFARTEFVMMLDVDFAICTDWRSAIRNAVRANMNQGDEDTLVKASRFNVRVDDIAGTDERRGKNETAQVHLMDRAVIQSLREGKIALVVPAFEYVRQEDGIDQSTFPRDKRSLIRLSTGTASKNKITTFHASWAPGHNSTDYAKFFSIPPGAEQVYEVPRTHYQSAYEPYVIMSKRVTWCDERFAGYGGNKAACLFEMYQSGVTFYVLSDHFLIHQSHTYEEEARREERKYNRKLYADFKEEVCLRYLHRFKQTGVLHTPMAANALAECRKIKNVVKIAPEVCRTPPVVSSIS